MPNNKEKTEFICQECGKVFKKIIPKSLFIQCPKCKSEDLEVNYY